MATIINKIKHTVKTGANKVKSVFRPVTEADREYHNDLLKTFENEQKRLVDRLQRGVYKTHGDLLVARRKQNESINRLQDALDEWDNSIKKKKEKDREEQRFRGEGIRILKQYEDIVDDYAKEKGICTFLEDKDSCKTAKTCYWFDKEDVAGKNVGCYSRKAPVINWSFPPERKRKKPTSLNTIEELVGGRRKTRKKRKKRKKKTRKKTHKKRRKTRKKRGGKKKKLTAKEYWKPKRFLGKTWWMPRKLKTGMWFHDTLKYGIPI